MTKNLKTNLLLRSVLAILFGLILVIWQSEVLRWMIVLLGIIALLAGAIQFTGFLIRTRGSDDRWAQMPFSALFAALFGILLLAGAQLWSDLLFICLGVAMLFIAIMQLFTLGRMKKEKMTISGLFYIFPVLLLLAGIFVLFSDGENWIIIFIGAWFIAYGVIEMLEYFSLKPNETAVAKPE